MNNFLQHLVERSLGAEPEPVRPRLAGPFESLPGTEPQLVELLPEQEAEEQARPHRTIHPLPASQAMAARPRTSPTAERPVPPAPAPHLEPELPQQLLIERAGEGEREARPHGVQQAEHEDQLQPPAHVEPAPLPEAPPERAPVRGRDPERAPARQAAAVPPQQAEPRPRRPEAPHEPERPRAVRIAPAMRPRQEGPPAGRPSDEIVPALPPSAAPSAPPPGRAASEQPQLPRVQVHIGRVEVRAVFAPPPAARPTQPRPAPTMSLDDYLKQRDGGS